jgi:hypothetical protein
MSFKHDIDAVQRFIDAAGRGDTPDIEDARAAALAIWDGVDKVPQFRKLLGIPPRGRGPKHDVSKVPLNQPVFTAAFTLAMNECTEAQAIEAVCQHYDDIDEKTAKTYLQQLKRRATRTARSRRAMRDAARRNKEK